MRTREEQTFSWAKRRHSQLLCRKERRKLRVHRDAQIAPESEEKIPLDREHYFCWPKTVAQEAGCAVPPLVFSLAHN